MTADAATAGGQHRATALMPDIDRRGDHRLQGTFARRVGGTRASWLVFTGLPLGLILALGAFLRFWRLDAVGFNSDEAVYTGTAASLAGNDSLRTMFPIFRAHPLLLQLVLSFGLHGPASDQYPRRVTAVAGLLSVVAVYAVGRRLYGLPVGLLAAAVLAVMPYDVVVSRQVLLDGPMTLLATGVLYCVVRYTETRSLAWVLGTGATLGATILTKETAAVLLGSLYVYFALAAPGVRRFRHLALGALVTAVVVLAFPLSLSLAGRSSTGQHYLLWQLFRRSNHSLFFYTDVVPGALGWAVVGLAVVGLIGFRRENTWRERLLLAWLLVPAAFFTLWPVKGYQYLLPIAPAFAVLAARSLVLLGDLAVRSIRRPRLAGWAVAVLALGTVASLVEPTWQRVNPSPSSAFLAGTGGVPGGREAGQWVAKNVPANAQLLAIGPSMANILEFYGERRISALSVSPNPSNRNPAYVPVTNPDLSMRRGQFQYVVWDTFTATRAPSFARELLILENRYHGVAVFTSALSVQIRDGQTVLSPAIIIYKVRAL